MNDGLDTDQNFNNIGCSAVTMNAVDRAKFKVSSLMNIAVIAP